MSEARRERRKSIWNMTYAAAYANVCAIPQGDEATNRAARFQRASDIASDAVKALDERVEENLKKTGICP